jgi:tetratricopeptide (TPR) repeat protein
VIGAVGLVVALPSILARLGAGGETLRLSFFQAAVRMFNESPLAGTGPGTWVAQRIAYTDLPVNDVYIPHAHDIYLQTLAEYGLLGAVAGGIAVILVGRLIVHAVRSGDQARVAMGWAAILGLTYFGGHQLLDFYPNMPAALFAMAIPLAWLDATELTRPVPASAPTGRSYLGPHLSSIVRPASPGLAIGIVVLAIGWLALSETRASMNASTVALMDQRDWVQAFDSARAVVAADPDMPVYEFNLGLAAARSGRFDESGAAFRRAAAADDLPESWLGLAAAQTELDDAPSARASLERALRLGVVQPAIALAAGQLYARLGDAPAARQAFLDGVVGAPTVLGDPDLRSLVGPVMTLDQLSQAAIDRARGGAGSIALALARDDRVQAETLASLLDPASQSLFSVVVPAWFGDASAWANVVALAQAHPMDIGIQNWAARVASHLRLPADQERYFEIANIDNGLSGLDGQEVRISPAGEGPADAGTSTAVYGLFTYRRPTPADMLPLTVTGLHRI